MLWYEHMSKYVKSNRLGRPAMELGKIGDHTTGWLPDRVLRNKVGTGVGM